MAGCLTAIIPVLAGYTEGYHPTKEIFPRYTTVFYHPVGMYNMSPLRRRFQWDFRLQLI